MKQESLPVYAVDHEEMSHAEWQLLVADTAKDLSESKEQRTKQPAVPENYESLLTDLQRKSVARLIDHGWEILFIRRSNPNIIITICHYPETGETSLVEKDGKINSSHGVKIRP